MSKYTTQVRFICENLAGYSESQDGVHVEDIIAEARPKLFDFDYPLFDPEYKPTLESKILRHFYTREIGLETFGLWKLKLNTKLNEIMPYYNQLYESELIEFNPMYDVNYTRSGSESLSQSESTANSLSMSQSESESLSENDRNSLLPESYTWELEQDTPQNGLTGIQNMEYLTKANKTQHGGQDQQYLNHSKSASSSGQSATSSTGRRQALDTKGYLESIVGYKSNNPSKLLEDYRDTFLNIDMMIIRDLDELFMQLW